MEMSFRLSDDGKSVCVSLPIQPIGPAQHTNEQTFSSLPFHLGSVSSPTLDFSHGFFNVFAFWLSFMWVSQFIGLGQLSQRG